MFAICRVLSALRYIKGDIIYNNILFIQHLGGGNEDRARVLAFIGCLLTFHKFYQPMRHFRVH